MKSEEFIEFFDPIELFSNWIADAKKHEEKNYNAFCLATSDVMGVPSARMILLKSFDERGFIFFTNLNSKKAKEFDKNVKVALCFYWKSLNKQVRIDGTIMDLPLKESDEYFSNRPRDSQIGSWASDQSNYIDGGYKNLIKKFAFYKNKFKGNKISRPKHWAGKIVVPEKIEFWSERKNRLHERVLFSAYNDEWKKEYLYP